MFTFSSSVSTFPSSAEGGPNQPSEYITPHTTPSTLTTASSCVSPHTLWQGELTSFSSRKGHTPSSNPSRAHCWIKHWLDKSVSTQQKKRSEQCPPWHSDFLRWTWTSSLPRATQSQECEHSNGYRGYERTLVWDMTETVISFPGYVRLFVDCLPAPVSHPELLWLPLMPCNWHFSQISSLTASGGMMSVSAFLWQMSRESWFRRSGVKIMMNKTRERGLFINGDRPLFHHFVIYFPNRLLGLTMWICILLKVLFQRKYSLV